MKIGDKVKVIARKFGHVFEIGEVVTLCTLETDSVHRFQGDSLMRFWMTEEEYKVMRPTTGTLAQLCVKPGDVVEFVEERSNPYGYEYPKGPEAVLDRGLVFGIKPEYDDAIWRIVSRECDLSNLDYTPINVEKPIYETEPDTRTLEHFQYGPVITETVTRIVPGVYGHIWIDWVVDGIVCLGLRNNALKKMDTVGLSRPEIIAARDILSQLIDAMADE